MLLLLNIYRKLVTILHFPYGRYLFSLCHTNCSVDGLNAGLPGSRIVLPFSAKYSEDCHNGEGAIAEQF
jgi:hypothetical protein